MVTNWSDKIGDKKPKFTFPNIQRSINITIKQQTAKDKYHRFSH